MPPYWYSFIQSTFFSCGWCLLWQDDVASETYISLWAQITQISCQSFHFMEERSVVPLRANERVDCVVFCLPTPKHLSGYHMAASLMIDGFTHSEFQMELQRGDVQTKACFSSKLPWRQLLFLVWPFTQLWSLPVIVKLRPGPLKVVFKIVSFYSQPNSGDTKDVLYVLSLHSFTPAAAQSVTVNIYSGVLGNTMFDCLPLKDVLKLLFVYICGASVHLYLS